MTSLGLLLGDAAALLALSLIAIPIARRRSGRTLVYGGALVISLVGLLAALTHFLSRASPETLVLPIGLPWLGAHFRLDALSAFSLGLIYLGAAAASLYALGYGRHERDPERVLPFYAAFLAGMALVPLADDAYTFLMAWEFMSLASWALVMSHHREAENARAGFVYIVMASFGTFALLLTMGLLAGAGGAYGFAAMRASSPPAGVATLALLLALVGAGSKAGLAPLHVWLPLAHPAAPSHVSALMSGVMTKVAVYAFVRVAFDLVGPADWRWSVPVLIVGAATALIGVLNAMMDSDLKRVLAYSTIENLGLVFVGLGLALAFKANDMGGASALAMTAALLHALNHSLFKSLLFFGAGAVLTATGERGMGRLGGLLNRMPATGLFMLVGCVAISALPPLNGFVSEWLMLQAVLLGPQFPQWTLKLLAPTIGAAIALVAALAAACFVRAFGIPFLGRPRSAAAEAARDVDRFSLAAMGALALLCLLAGVIPGLMIDALKPVVQMAVGAAMPLQSKLAWLSIAPIAAARSSYNGLLVFLFIAMSASLAATVIYRFASAALRRAPAWDCGFPEPSSATQYTAESFSQPIRRVFGNFAFRARETVDMPAPGQTHAAVFRVVLHDRIWEAIYGPIVRIVEMISTRLDHLQFLTIRQYLSVVFGSLVFLLLLLGGVAMIPGMAVDLVFQLLQMTLVIALAPALTGLVRKAKARLLRRRGPTPWQPYRDLYRLARKEAVVAESASWLFRIVPYLVFAATWVAAALAPTFATELLFSWSADLIAIVALLGAARFFLALAGLDVGTSFGGLGASREAMFATLAEPAMITIVFSLALIAGSTQLSTIAAVMTSGVGLRVTLGMALIALVIVAIAENGRIPVDNPATHLELTMVHEAMALEYSGRHLALIELAAMLKLLLYVSIIACVFMPWGLAIANASIAARLIGAGLYVVKLAVAGLALALFETSIAKMRVFRAPDFVGVALMLGFLGALLLFVSRTLK